MRSDLRKFKPYKKRKSDGIYSENVIKRNFSPEELNKVWAGDITYIRTNLGCVSCGGARSEEQRSDRIRSQQKYRQRVVYERSRKRDSAARKA